MKTGMVRRIFSKVSISRRAGVAALFMSLVPGIAFATHFELSRLAVEIELISDQLADELRYTRHYGSVRQRAVTLRREASQLADALRRNRSNSRIRSQFKDVRRGYERLEQAFFNADRRDHNPHVYSEINLLSSVFANLNEEFYYAGLGGQINAPFYDLPYGGLTIIGSGRAGLGRDRSRQIIPRQYNNRNRGPATSRRIVPNRERAIPPVFRGNSSRATPNRQSGRAGRAGRDGTAAPNRITRGLQRAPAVEHRSNVLERQGRQNRERRELEGQARGNRSSSVRQSPARREANVQRGRSSRGSVTESRRRNHYE
jgi:hypothetical protein